MDNNNNNEFYGDQPQKPFNETPRQNPAQGFEPQHPFAPQTRQYTPQPPQYRPQQQYTPQPQQTPPAQRPPQYPAPGPQQYRPQPPQYQPQQQYRPQPPQYQPPQPQQQMPPQYAPPQPPQYQPQPQFDPRQQYTPEAQNQDAFNPIEHTAEYEDGAFEHTDSVPSADADFSDFIDEPDMPEDIREAYKSFDEPAEPYQVRKTPTAAAINPASPYAQQPLPNQPQTAPKQKGNKGLIAVIIVLSVLLAASLIGILIYSIGSSAGNNSSESKKDNPIEELIPDFTFPNIDETKPRSESNPEKEDKPETTKPVHDESDYSDQVNKNYAGLKLESKPADAETGNYNAETAFSKASPSVVGVLCYTDKDQNSVGSEGSGIIISDDGYVITNAHVIGNSKTAYGLSVVTEDGVKYTAGVVGFDSRTDIALLKLKDAKGLPAATFGDSEALTLGEDILIIGNPGGLNYQNSMTKGIVSAIDREASSKSIVKYIQTDAAINPGNSGGPAVNMYGQVIGIASAKIVDDKYENMGFCIPSATVKKIVDDLMKNGYIEGRVKIGISGYAVTSSDKAMYDIPAGIIIDNIEKGGPCDGTGLREEDIITEADGTTITSFADMYKVLENHKAGDKIKIKYYRYDDESKGEVEITLQADK